MRHKIRLVTIYFFLYFFMFTHHTVCVVATGPGAGVSAVMGPAGVPLWAVQVMVTVARAEISDTGPTYRVTIPARRKSGTNFPSQV